MIVPWNEYRHNMASPTFLAQGIAVKSFVAAHALGSSLFSIDRDAVNCSRNKFLVMVVGLADPVGNGMPAGFADDRSFNAVNPVFS